MSIISHVAEKLRKLAEDIEVSVIPPPAPDMSFAEAIKALRQSYKRGELTFEIEWRDFKAENEIIWKFRKDYSSGEIKSKSLRDLVAAALTANSPDDTLDRIDAMMPACKSIPKEAKAP